MDERAGALRRRAPGRYELAGIERAAGNFVDHAQRCRNHSIRSARFLPAFRCAAISQAPEAARSQSHFQVFEDRSEAREDVAEAGKIAGGGFGEDHAAGASAGACADAAGFEDGDGFFGCEQAQPCGRGEAGESAADDGEVDGVRKGVYGATA